MSRTYLVHLPRAEARYLAGISTGWPVTPEARCMHAVREWLNGVKGRRSAQVPLQKIVADLEPILAQVPIVDLPVCGPFASQGGGNPSLPGRVEYLGGGAVRLDEAAIGALAELREGDDFRVVMTDAGPVLSVGTDRYPACREA